MHKLPYSQWKWKDNFFVWKAPRLISIPKQSLSSCSLKTSSTTFWKLSLKGYIQSVAMGNHRPWCHYWVINYVMSVCLFSTAKHPNHSPMQEGSKFIIKSTEHLISASGSAHTCFLFSIHTLIITNIVGFFKCHKISCLV